MLMPMEFHADTTQLVQLLDKGHHGVELDDCTAVTRELVAEVFDEQTVKGLPGHFAIGHVRYSTSGSSNLINAQPIQVASHRGAVSLAHNGILERVMGIEPT